jgi:hypothetical protein
MSRRARVQSACSTTWAARPRTTGIDASASSRPRIARCWVRHPGALAVPMAERQRSALRGDRACPPHRSGGRLRQRSQRSLARRPGPRRVHDPLHGRALRKARAGRAGRTLPGQLKHCVRQEDRRLGQCSGMTPERSTGEERLL